MRRVALVAGLLAWLVAGSAMAQGQDQPGGEPDQPGEGIPAQPGEGDQAEADTAEAGTEDQDADEVYEPDQRGYEPDQRGYEPDQRGAVEEPEDEDQLRYEVMREPTAGAAADMSTERQRLLWITFFSGYSYVDLGQFDLDNLVPAGLDLRRSGSVTGLATGFRVSHVTFGLRGSFAIYDGGLRLGTLGFDTAFRFRAGPVEPYFRFGTGFVWLGGLGYDHPRRSEVPITALLTELGAGVTGMVNEHLSLGAGVDFGVLRLRRDALDGCATPAECMAGDADLAREGDALGLRLDFHLSLGVHF